MTYPQPAAPQYPQQQPAYPQPTAPQYPQQQPAYPQAPQQYAPPAYPQAPQQYAPPAYPQAPQQPPAPPAPTGPQPTLDDFFSQPAAGWGPAWSWTKPPKPMGTTFVGVVARPLTPADIEQQTQPNSTVPMTYRDGRPVLVMKVPMQVQPSAEYPEGKAQWYVQGQSRDELARAMAEAGAPAGPPEAGAVIEVTWVSERRNNYGTMSKQFQVRYQRPQGAAPASAPAQAPPAEQPASAPQAPPAAPVQVPQQAPATTPGPVPPAPGNTGVLDPARAALLAQLSGQPAPVAGT